MGRLAFFGYLDGLRHQAAFVAHLAPLRRKNWFVYAKPPPERLPKGAGPEAVLAYLARYTHRVAISNGRLVDLDKRGVTFRYKDSRRNGRARFRTMTLAPDEFIRRFLLHVLPRGFHRVRHYGLLASATCKTNVARPRELIAMAVPVTDPPVEHDDADRAASVAADHCPPCPCCGGRMIIVETFERCGAPRAPPPRQIPIDGRLLAQPPRVSFMGGFRTPATARADRSRSAGIRNPCVDGPRLARAFLQLGRVWSIAVMCPASVCGRVDRGPRWVTRIGAPNITAGLTPKGFPGVFRSSVRPIAILLLSLQAPGQNEVSRLRPQAAGDRPRRSPSWPRASGPSCWPARLPQASSACAPAN
jgi:Putative transposase